ncbi:CAAX family protease [Companilactobacillus paralimentarius DSM 13238 = JCM 10415]|uniref:CAAX family protease n=2 Tax=Companilactobacillus paralimentarius TaxID=83526 RepID=A0A0R1PPR3_9LACO|nr:CAAX protease [Companilactobacillus paralimentarius]KRL31890.1 CAAX family protease [Companilactobacillus paralimentarius DSM 13238 = JCM 10415]QFR70670.1 CPBP family intramembrane metalloprotease [Companilactobacillus paralimentarius]
MLSITGSIYFVIITLGALIATGLMMYLVKLNGPNDFEEKNDLNHNLQWIILGTIGAIALQYGVGFIDQLIFHTSTHSQNTMQLLLMVKAYPYYFLYVLICAPIMEEIVFRRIFFANMIKPTNIYIAAIISALLFAFMHQDTRFIVYVAMGLWFSFVYYKSKNIYASAGSHILMNAIVLTLSMR